MCILFIVIYEVLEYQYMKLKLGCFFLTVPFVNNIVGNGTEARWGFHMSKVKFVKLSLNIGKPFWVIPSAAELRLMTEVALRLQNTFLILGSFDFYK